MAYTGDQKRQYQNEWLKNRRLEWIKENGPCKKCGSSEQLEVDHIIPEEKLTHKVWSWSKTRRDAELVKCQVLCHDCHLAKSTQESSQRNKGVALPELRAIPDEKFMEVVLLMNGGMRQGEACNKVGLNPRTFASHKRRGYRKEVFSLLKEKDATNSS